MFLLTCGMVPKVGIFFGMYGLCKLKFCHHVPSFIAWPRNFTISIYFYCSFCCYSLQQTVRSDYDKVISETEGAYQKIMESSQTLLSVLKRESANIEKKAKSTV